MSTELVSSRIKNKRKQCRMTQQELADKVGVSLMTVLRWEKGERTPNISIMPQLSEALNVSAGYLMGLEDTPEPRAIQTEQTPIKENTTREKQVNMAAVTLENGKRAEAPATPEGYAFLEKLYLLSLSGKSAVATA